MGGLIHPSDPIGRLSASSLRARNPFQSRLRLRLPWLSLLPATFSPWSDTLSWRRGFADAGLVRACQFPARRQLSNVSDSHRATLPRANCSEAGSVLQ